MGKEILSSIYNSIRQNKGKWLGTVLGLIGAILVLTIGFFKTLFIYILVWLGSFIGRKKDEGIAVRELLISLVDKINKEYK